MAFDINGYNETFKAFVDFAQARAAQNDRKSIARGTLGSGVREVVERLFKMKFQHAFVCGCVLGMMLVSFGETVEGVTLEAPIATWDDGIPLGNGGAGALLWGGGDTLNVTLDRADFWHNIDPSRYGSPDFTWETLVDVVAKKDDARRSEVFDKGESATKLPGVRFVMKLGEGQTLRRFCLDYRTGITTVTVATPQGEREVRAWFDNGDKLLSLQVPEDVSFVSKDFVKNPSFEKLGGYPEAEFKIDNAKAVYRRARRKGADNRFDTDFEAGVRFCDAVEYNKRKTSKEAEFWARFNAKSSVSIPDADMQRQYDFAMYLYGAGARAGHPPLALQGLWTADNGKLPPWHGDYHNDMNTEMTYWAAGPAGHIEALEAFADFFIERLPECRAFCRKIFKGGDGAVIPPTMGYAAQPILGWTAYTLPPIHGIWAFNTFCDAWDYDPTPEKAVKYLAFGRELAAGLEHSWKMVDGVRKLDLSCSPEVGNNSNGCFLTPNSTYERVILDNFYTWLARLAEVVEASSTGRAACPQAAARCVEDNAPYQNDESRKWRSYVGTFGPPNVTADGVLELAAGRLLGASHRHPSHLLQVFPLVDVPIDAGVDFTRSVDQWEALTTKAWVGFSFPWAGCFEARLGRGDRAFRYLKDFQRAFTSRCGFNLNGDQLKCGLSNHTYRPFTLEANFGYARGIQEMLLSYDPHKKEVHLFRALPKEWDGKEVSFRNLRVPGGCRISAQRTADGKAYFTAEGRLPGPVVYNGRRMESPAVKLWNAAYDRAAMSDAYWAIWNDAEQARIDADIEANRKVDASVAVDAPDGTEVCYEQLTHDFRFGASTFNFGQLGSPELNRRYEAAFGEGGVFNQGTVPFYWREYEPDPGVIRAFDGEATVEEYWNALPHEKVVKERFWRRPPPGKVIDFLKRKGLRVHGHILVTGGLRPEWLYDKFCPEEEKAYLERLGLPRRETYKAEGKEWEFAQFRGFCEKKLYPKMSEREIAAALPGWTGAMSRLWTQRVLDIGALFGGKADSWDVVNESSKDFVQYGKSRTGLPVWKSFKGIMPGDFPLVALLDAKRAFPATTELAINDNNINDDFLKQVRNLTAEGARIDLVGCQMHIMRESYMQSLAAGKKHVNWVGTPKTIRDRLDMMARTGRRIHISEITIPQAGRGEKGLAIQAIAVRNLYRIWFSHKAVAGITWWNLVDGCSFPGEPQISGLFTRDMRPKPAYDVLNALVNGEWKSKGAVSAKDGKVSFRGFRGRYRLTWKIPDGNCASKDIVVK